MRNEQENGEGQSVGILDLVPANTLGTIIRSELDVAISTAKAYPRSIAHFKQSALAMATLDEETAASCFYAVPRAGKSVEGPSVRLAEIVVSAWGNIRSGARVIGDDGRIITAQGVCTDMERNVSVTVDVRRRVTDKKGRRFSDDMVVVTGNAACAIALRNAIFKVVPFAFVKSIYDAAKRLAIGDAKTLVNKRADMLGYFQKMGVPAERVLLAVGKTAADDVGLEELAVLKGLATAIKDGDTTVDEAFPAPHAPTAEAKKEGSKSDQLADKLAARSDTSRSVEMPSPIPPTASPSEPDAPKEEKPAFLGLSP